MTIAIRCPNSSCQAQASVNDSLSGRSVKCKRCGTPFVITATLDGDPSETAGSQPNITGDPFPKLPAEFGRYRVLKLLGKGGMGAVYLAEDSQLTRKVALKIPFFDVKTQPKRAERFVREARSAAILQHPNICTVYDTGMIAGRPFITMACIEGKPLEQLVDEDQPMPQRQAAELVVKIALALQDAHDHDIVHRDLKPANIMINNRGEPIVMDFGLAKRVNEVEQAATNLTHHGTLMGTPKYMSPEQVMGSQDKIGPATDIYALGVILFELLTGKTPYNGSLAMILGQILTAPIPPVRQFREDIDPQLEAICTRAMAKDPYDRFPLMAGFAKAIEEYLKFTIPKIDVPGTTAPIAATPVPKVSIPIPTMSRTDAPKHTDAVVSNPWAISDSPEAEPLPPQRNSLSRRSILALAVLIMLPLCGLMAMTVLRFDTPNGTLVVEIDDAETEARFKNGKVILSGADDKVRYTLSATERDTKIDAGEYKLRVEGADGLVVDTSEFLIKKGDKVTVRVRIDPKAFVKQDPAPVNFDIDRKAAEAVLAMGGAVQLNAAARELTEVAKLPKQFMLTGVNLAKKPLNPVELVAIAACKNLMHLNFENTLVNDTNLSHFTGMSKLGSLDLDNTAVTDAGLVPFQACKTLFIVSLRQTAIGDAGFAHFKDCKTLRQVYLSSTKVTDRALADLKDCKNLTKLTLEKTAITDQGLLKLKDCKGLVELYLRDTKVTMAGVADLKVALPLCKIDWNGGTFEPMAVPSPERKAAEFAFSIGGVVSVNGELVDIASADKLPSEAFQLTKFNLHGRQVDNVELAALPELKDLSILWLNNSSTNNEGLAPFARSKNLTQLHIWGTQVTNEGLAPFADLKEITQLSLGNTRIGDDGLAHLAKFQNVTHIWIANNPITDVGMTHLKNYKNLTSLMFDNVPVTDTGLASLKDCQKLTVLGLVGTQVTDAGMATVINRKNLTALSLQRTKVTAAKIDELKKALPQCKIEWDGGIIEPTQP